jgi:hypothetical protein
MLGRTFCVLLLALGMTVVLAAPGGAAPRPPRGRDSVTCSLSAGTTFTWTSDIATVHYEFDRSDGTATEIGFFKTHGSSYTIGTAPDAATVQTIFLRKDGSGAKLPPATCTA